MSDLKIQNILNVNEKLEEFLGALLHLLCGRCWRDIYAGGVSKNTHNSGNIRKAFCGNKDINLSLFEKWVRDTDHGLFHGIATCFMISLHDPSLSNKIHQIIENYEKDPTEEETLFGSAILHDFYKTAFNINAQHDVLLKKYFPDLRQSTYSHSKPPNIFDKLVVGDRLELHRYADHGEWLNRDNDFKKYLDEPGWDLVDAFYSFVRPALLKIFVDRNKRWIRHGIDNPNKTLRPSNKYPTDRQIRDVRQEEDTIYWSIETFKYPFDGCMTHGSVGDKSGKVNVYGRLYGLMPLMDFKSISGKHLELCVETPDTIRNNHFGKDHFCSNGSVPISNWTYLYSEYDGFTPELKDSFAYLIENNARVVSHKAAKIWLLVSDKIMDIFLGLRVK